MVARSWHGPAEALLLPIGALVAALLAFGLFVWFGGSSPVEAWTLLFRGAFGDAFGWQNTLQRAAPLMLTALAVALPARAGLTVIGGEGALVLGAAMAMSSTAIVVKLMAERLELESEHGRRVIAVLLFQDLAVVPLLEMSPEPPGAELPLGELSLRRGFDLQWQAPRTITERLRLRASAYLDYLKQYSDQQRSAGRFERPTNVRMRSVMEWLKVQQVLPSDVSLQLWLAFGFLAVCLTNTVGLQLAKALRRSGEIGVRRALGAPKREIFVQFLVEAGSLGLVGGLLGLALTGLGIWAVRQGSSDYAKLVQMDVAMLATTLGLALLASLFAGLLPAWRAAQVQPALQLKTQ